MLVINHTLLIESFLMVCQESSSFLHVQPREYRRQLVAYSITAIPPAIIEPHSEFVVRKHYQGMPSQLHSSQQLAPAPIR